MSKYARDWENMLGIRQPPSFSTPNWLIDSKSQAAERQAVEEELEACCGRSKQLGGFEIRPVIQFKDLHGLATFQSGSDSDWNLQLDVTCIYTFLVSMTEVHDSKELAVCGRSSHRLIQSDVNRSVQKERQRDDVAKIRTFWMHLDAKTTLSLH